MPDVYDMHVSLRWQAKTGSTYDGEIALWGFRLRPGAVGQTWPTHGTLTPTAVDVVNEFEDTTDYVIEWAHVDKGLGTKGFTQANLKAVADHVRTGVATMANSISSSYELTEIRMQARQADGKSPAGSNKFFLKTPIEGGATGSFTPNQAIVLTHQSYAPGRKGKGRTYVGPVASAVLGSDGLIANASQAALRGSWAVMFGDIIGDDALTPTNVSFPSFEFWDIQAIECGDEMDVQNRRRRQRPENYSSEAIVP